MKMSNSTVIPIDHLKSDKQDVLDWFEEYERITKSYDWDTKKRGKRLPSFLKGPAARIWEDVKEKYRYDYKKLKKILCKKLRADNARSLATKEFYKIKQNRSESAEDFGYKIKKLTSRAHITKKKEIINTFVEGTTPSLRQLLSIRKYTSINEAIREAKRLENVLEETKKISSEDINEIIDPNLQVSEQWQPQQQQDQQFNNYDSYNNYDSNNGCENNNNYNSDNNYVSDNDYESDNDIDNNVGNYDQDWEYEDYDNYDNCNYDYDQNLDSDDESNQQPQSEYQTIAQFQNHLNSNQPMSWETHRPLSSPTHAPNNQSNN